jgi:WhiB family redox-sensing transcriptional regulator
LRHNAARMVAHAHPVWLDVAANVPAWQRDALCIEHPEVEFFEARGHSGRAAKAICAKCLCQADCLGFALDEELESGIWGGTSTRQRKALAERGVTGDLVRRFGPYVDVGREIVAHEKMLGWLLDEVD